MHEDRIVKIASLAQHEKSLLCGVGIGLFSDTPVFIKSRSQSLRFRGTTDKKPSRGSTGLNVHQKCMGFPRPIPQPEKGLFPSCGGPLRGAVKSETKSEIRRSSAHMCNSHGDTYASTVRIQFIYISPSTDIPPGTEFILILPEYFLSMRFTLRYFSPFLPPPPVLLFFSFFGSAREKPRPWNALSACELRTCKTKIFADKIFQC